MKNSPKKRLFCLLNRPLRWDIMGEGPSQGPINNERNMDIFSALGPKTIEKSTPNKNINLKEDKKGYQKSKPKDNRPTKLDLSPDEIRDMVARNSGKKSLPAPALKIEPPSFMELPEEKIGEGKTEPQVEAKTESQVEVETEEEPIIGDIGKNDPNDTDTQEKLKTILKSGGFAFSPKEREVLGDILDD